MLILAIVVSTMIVVALVVFATQYHAYIKDQAKRDKLCARKGSTGRAQEASAAS